MCRLVKNIFENLKRYSFSKNSGTSDTVNADLTFSPLTPTDEAKDCESYMGALSWALNQDKIHNIAISGPYGSGKSSVIRTFLSPHGQQSKYKHMDCSPPGSSVHGILQVRILEWVAIPFSRGSSPPRDPTWSPA